jgi:hypothetical protein
MIAYGQVSRVAVINAEYLLGRAKCVENADIMRMFFASVQGGIEESYDVMQSIKDNKQSKDKQ